MVLNYRTSATRISFAISRILAAWNVYGLRLWLAGVHVLMVGEHSSQRHHFARTKGIIWQTSSV